jgi:SAM-dependent methyltransferase
MTDHPHPTAEFYDRTAAQYDSQVGGAADTVRLRESFRQRVSAMAGPGTTILDFGCGTGTDAAWYASQGHAVIAYDISEGMLDVLRRSCSAAIAAGRIRSVAGELPALIEQLDGAGPVAAVASNLAVLNHLQDLRPVFQALAPHIVSGGVFLASILNPFYWHSIASGWWWKGMPRSLWTGCITMHGAVTTHRHYVRSIRRMAGPQFELVSCEGSLRSNFLILSFRKAE